MPTTSKGLRYPSSSAAPNVPQDIQNLASDVDTALFFNGGTTGVLAGSAPPAGRALVHKTYQAIPTTNASGDVTVSYPTAAFSNGVLSVRGTVYSISAPAVSYQLVPYAISLSSVTFRAFNVSTGAAAASTSLGLTVHVIGW